MEGSTREVQASIESLHVACSSTLYNVVGPFTSPTSFFIHFSPAFVVSFLKHHNMLRISVVHSYVDVAVGGAHLAICGLVRPLVALGGLGGLCGILASPSFLGCNCQPI